MAVNEPPAWVLQRDYTVRCEWGPNAVRALAPGCGAVVVVDVLSFCTCVDVAAGRGASVLPYRFGDPGAARYAEQRGALLADRNPHGYGLSPASLTDIEPGCRLVLPSPNGSALSFAAAAAGVDTVIAGCLRNRSAAAWEAAVAGGPILVVPAGERWNDGSLRPAFEDLCGAGAVIDALPGSPSLSPEAEAARQVFQDARSRLADRIAACASGREKRTRAEEADVALAASLDASDGAPVLRDGVYECGAGGGRERRVPGTADAPR